MMLMNRFSYALSNESVHMLDKQKALHIKRRRLSMLVVTISVFLIVWALCYHSFVLSATALDPQSNSQWERTFHNGGTFEQSSLENRQIEPSESDRRVKLIEKGDTLWKIAVQYGPESIDPRDYIDQLKVLNGLESSSLIEGQLLYLP